MIVQRGIVNRNLSFMMGCHRFCEVVMGLAATEKELADKTTRFLKGRLKQGGVTYAELAKRLDVHGLKETEASITNKLSRGTLTATFLLATLAALEMEGMRLEDL
jgi:hypothetical protein